MRLFIMFASQKAKVFMNTTLWSDPKARRPNVLYYQPKIYNIDANSLSFFCWSNPLRNLRLIFLSLIFFYSIDTWIASRYFVEKAIVFEESQICSDYRWGYAIKIFRIHFKRLLFYFCTFEWITNEKFFRWSYKRLVQ